MRIRKRKDPKTLRLVGVIIAVVGLFLLHLCIRYRELPLVTISEITPIMNFRKVRIRGRLVNDVRQLRSGTVLYVVDDGTGTLAVFSEPPAGELPKAGSRITAAGSLSVGAGNEVRMRAFSSAHIRIEGVADSSSGAAGVITADMEGEDYTLVGRVTSVWKPPGGSKAPRKIMLECSAGTVEVVHWLRQVPDYRKGAQLEISGIVTLYRGKVQLKVKSPDDIRPVKAFPEEVCTIEAGNVSASLQGRWVAVVGTLGEPRSIPGGVVYPLSDDSGNIEVVFWDHTVSGGGRDAMDEGIRVRIHAPVDLYKGRPQLVPQDVGGFQVLE